MAMAGYIFNGILCLLNALNFPSKSVLTAVHCTTFIFPKDFLDSNLSCRLYKSPKQSNSFSDINELSHLDVTSRAKSMAKDDMSTTTSRRSGRLRSRRHPTPPSPIETAKTTEEDLDFSKWRVSIPFYTSAGRSSSSVGSRGGFKTAAASAATNPLMLMMMNPEQPDFSLFPLAASSQGYYTVIAEREVNGKTVSSRVRSLERFMFSKIHLIILRKTYALDAQKYTVHPTPSRTLTWYHLS
ncbi:hypothetical protein TSMEX_002836 [Taenia solium]|eukprot:TsM_001028700 transcript=TsM_001028700 gene=TsM_001028700